MLTGLPSVTLLGVKADWELLESKLEKLKEYGEEPTVWYGLLEPVMRRFVRTFEVLDSEEVLDFWQCIVHYKRGGSGPSYLSGWITAFCFWTEDGRCMYKDPGPETERNHRSVCAPKVSWTERQKGWNDLSYPYLVLDGVAFNRIYMESIPQGYGSVPVKVDDHGKEIETVMVAGLWALSVRVVERRWKGVGWAVILCSRFRGGGCLRRVRRIRKSREWRMIDR